MPVILRYKAYKFFFFSNERIPREPVHIHIRKDNCLAKAWIVPEVKLVYNYGFSSTELKEIVLTVNKNKDLIERRWNEYFG